MATIYDLTPSEIAALQNLAVLLNNNDLLVQSDLNDQLLKFNAGYKAKPTFFLAEISSGTATVERQAQISYCKIDTEGQNAIDQVETIAAATGTSFNQGDLLVCTVESAARTVQFQETSTGNLLMNEGDFNAQETNAFIAFRFTGSSFVEQARYPTKADSRLTLANETTYVSSGAVTISTPYVTVIGELTGETLAQGSVQITATTGASGSVSVYSDEGEGDILLGTATYTSSTTPAALALVLEAAIDALTTDHGYDATIAGAGSDTNNIDCPVGSGSGGNSYNLSVVTSGGATATVTVAFAGGVDGSEADDTIDTINGGSLGRLLVIENGMSSNILTLQSGGNISITDVINIPAGDVTMLVFTGTNWKLHEPSVQRWVEPRISIGELLISGATLTRNTGAGVHIKFNETADDEISGNVTLAHNGVNYTGVDLAFVLFYQLETTAPIAGDNIILNVDWYLTEGDASENAETLVNSFTKTIDVSALNSDELYSVQLDTMTGKSGADILQFSIERNSTGGGSDTYNDKFNLYAIRLIKA
ncbi:MAG: hypothetical protein GWN62_16820 [Aliifodinibius sp.]|nr:hypothetical protein [Fodinibius sp.]